MKPEDNTSDSRMPGCVGVQSLFNSRSAGARVAIRGRLLLFALAILVCISRVHGQSAPTNDDFVNAGLLEGTNVHTTVANTYASKEPGEPNHAGSEGGKSVWWKWQAPETGFVTISTAGSMSDTAIGYPLDTVLALYTGSDVSNLAEVDSNDDGPSDVTSELSCKVTAGTVYYIAVDGFNFGSTPADADSGLVIMDLKFSPGLPEAASWILPGIDGTMIHSTNYAGKVIVLNFWATWCPPCVAEIPDLISLQIQYGPDGLVVIGVSMDSSEDGINPPTSLVQTFASDHGMNYPIVMSRPDYWSVETSYGGIPYIPNTFVIDRDNKIETTFVGSQSYATFERTVKPLLYSNLKVSASVLNGQFRIVWPAIQAPVALESTDDPAAGSWAAVQQPVQSDGSNQFVEMPIEDSIRFFRLKTQ